jgi:iron complex transport system substrate-binding protein
MTDGVLTRITLRSALVVLATLFAVAVATGCSTTESTAQPAATSTPVDLIAAAATSQPEATATISPTATAEVDPRTSIFATVPGILEPSNFGWPRTVETSTGVIEITSRPERVYSLSLGHAEIIAALRGGEVLVATASFFKDPGTSASFEEFAGSPDAGSDPEEVIGLDPEIVIASAFTSADLIEQLTAVGVTVLRADLEDSALGNVPNILLLGYMMGAEDRAIELANEVTSRVEFISETVEANAPARPRAVAMSRWSDIYVAGEGSTEGGIIAAAGGVNAASEDGIVSHQVVGIEGIAAMNPDIIILTQPKDSALAFAEELYSDPVLADVPAVKNRKIVYGDPTIFTTLSHWNVRGIEESAKIFYPEIFGDVTFPAFTHP